MRDLKKWHLIMPLLVMLIACLACRNKTSREMEDESPKIDRIVGILAGCTDRLTLSHSEYSASTKKIHAVYLSSANPEYALDHAPYDAAVDPTIDAEIQKAASMLMRKSGHVFTAEWNKGHFGGMHEVLLIDQGGKETAFYQVGRNPEDANSPFDDLAALIQLRYSYRHGEPLGESPPVAEQPKSVSESVNEVQMEALQILKAQLEREKEPRALEELHRMLDCVEYQRSLTSRYLHEIQRPTKPARK